MGDEHLTPQTFNGTRIDVLVVLASHEINSPCSSKYKYMNVLVARWGSTFGKIDWWLTSTFYTRAISVMNEGSSSRQLNLR